MTTPGTAPPPTTTWTGAIRAVYTAPVNDAPTEARASVRALAGVGLEGDRHARVTPSETARVSLIEAEAIEAANRDYGLTLSEGEARRNIVTVGVALNHLVGREFLVGEVRLRGLKLCEPCGHLQQLTGQQVTRALRHRGGLYAEILTGGTIAPGDPVTPAQ